MILENSNPIEKLTSIMSIDRVITLIIVSVLCLLGGIINGRIMSGIINGRIMSGKPIFKNHIPDKEKLLNEKVFTSIGQKILYFGIIVICIAASIFENYIGIRKLVNDDRKVAIQIDEIVSMCFMFCAVIMTMALVGTLIRELKTCSSDNIHKIRCTRQELYEDRGYSDKKINNILIDYYREFYHCSDRKISELIGVDICKDEEDSDDD